MGLSQFLTRLILGGRGVEQLAQASVEVVGAFRPNANRQLELGHEAYQAAQSAHAAEFQYGRAGWFDAFVNGLNRLPRPSLALGTLGLFAYAMIDPVGFSQRMVGLSAVPDPLWWLLGAVVAFYFGARETHYMRSRPTRDAPAVGTALQPEPPARSANPALRDWATLGAVADDR